MQPVRVLADDPCLTDILALLHRAFAYMEDRIDPPSSLHQLTVAGMSKTCESGEVWASGAPVVACVFLTIKPNGLYVGKLAVDPKQRGKGLARQLVELAAQRAKARGLDMLELQTRIELVENHTTFERLGFQKVAEDAHPGFDRPTGIVMQKTL